jgi:acyl carrier protein
VQTIRDRVRAFIVENFLFGSTDTGLDGDTSFFDTRIIDSTGILELVAFLEETYELHVEDHELEPANLDTLNRIAAFVERKRMRADHQGSGSGGVPGEHG